MKLLKITAFALCLYVSPSYGMQGEISRSCEGSTALAIVGGIATLGAFSYAYRCSQAGKPEQALFVCGMGTALLMDTIMLAELSSLCWSINPTQTQYPR